LIKLCQNIAGVRCFETHCSWNYGLFTREPYSITPA